MANGKGDKLVASPNTRVQQGFSDVVTEADNLSPSQAAKIAESGFKAKPIAGAGHNPPKPLHALAISKIPGVPIGPAVRRPGLRLPRPLRGKGLVSSTALRKMRTLTRGGV
jgi:hypothetical protein